VSEIKKAEESETKRVNINIPVPLHNAFKSAVAARGVDMTTVLLQFIEGYVEKHGPSASQPKGRRK
jgi:predicted DNA binding CopG/RHH family protein